MEPGADSELFPLFAASTIKPRLVVLDPGQALYVPPYWFIRSEFSSVSVFLDVKSLSKVQVLLATAQFVDIPLGNFSSVPEERIVGSQVPSLVSCVIAC